ncbi:MAG: DMT family transporter [Acidobacteria bacterium]|nr:MAG: DMT family transporter [Acidobacteriota bacterium]
MLYALLTGITLLAFAANSLLCRTALGAGLIDPVSFSTLRLVSGAIVLVPLAWLTGKSRLEAKAKGSWGSSLALFIYAIAFSLAYVSLDAGMGALILFGAVQATMVGMGLKSGEQLHAVQWLGLISALGGLTYLFSPGIAAPDPVGVLLMLSAGVAWGLYSVRGRRAAAPVSSTAANFLRAVPISAGASLLALSFIHAQPAGIILAVVSGGLTSGLGYVLWYKALRGLTTTQAAVVQLLVPILAAFGGIAFLGERLSVRLAISSALILGGVAVAALSRASRRDTAALPSKT